MATGTVGGAGAKRLPGPPSIPLLGWRFRGLQMLRDPARFFTNLYEQYGEIVAWDPRHPTHLFVAGDHYRRLFAQPETFIVDGFRPVKLPRDSAMTRLSANLLSLDGEKHARHRRLMQPAFTTGSFARHAGVIVDRTNVLLSGWRVGDVKNVDREMNRLITAIAIRTMFGIYDAAQQDRIHALIATLLSATSSPLTLILPLAIPGTPYRRMLRTSEHVEQFIREAIADKRRERGAGGDVLSVLLAASEQEQDGFTDAELIGELYTVLCHETVGSALLWTLLLLDQHPQVLADVQDEVDAVLRGGPPTIESLDRLVLLTAVLKESMRLFPAVTVGNRYVAEPAELGGYALQKGAVVFFSSYVNHRLPDVFSQPRRFDPARWGRDVAPTRTVYAPFGIGTHSCIAMYFAMAEMKIILAMMLQRFSPRLPPDTRVDRGMRFSLVPRPELVLRLEPRGTLRPRTEMVGNVRASLDLD